MSRPDELVPLQPSQLPATAPVRYLAREMMDRRGFNPIEKMIDLAEQLEKFDKEYMATNPDSPPVMAEKRMKIYSAMAKWYAPQPKTVEVSVKEDRNMTIEVKDFSKFAQERAAFIPKNAVYTGPQLMGVVETEFDD